LSQRYPDYILTLIQAGYHLVKAEEYTEPQQVLWEREESAKHMAQSSEADQRAQKRNFICRIPTEPRYLPMNGRAIEASSLKTSNAGSDGLWR
jgi:hypothetical protein